MRENQTHTVRLGRTRVLQSPAEQGLAELEPEMNPSLLQTPTYLQCLSVPSSLSPAAPILVQFAKAQRHKKVIFTYLLSFEQAEPVHASFPQGVATPQILVHFHLRARKSK